MIANSLTFFSFQAHVFDILKSKFSDYRDFHTMLYTCAKEFDFLGTEMPIKATKTLLIPTALASCLLFIYNYFFPFVRAMLSDELNSEEEEKEKEKEKVSFNSCNGFITDLPIRMHTD